MASKKRRTGKPKPRAIHLMHHRAPPYTHSYCGWVNFADKWPGNFTRQLKQVTCKRCLKSIEADGGKVVAFDRKLKEWAEKIRQARKKGKLPKAA